MMASRLGQTSAPQLLWRQVLKATIDTLNGRSRGQYDIRLANPEGIEAFLAGLPRHETDLRGYTVEVPIAAASEPIVVPAMSIEIAYVGEDSKRKDWRIPSQRPATAYPLWRAGVGLLDSTQPKEDFVVLIRDPGHTFHARWLRADAVSSLPERLSERLLHGTAGVELLTESEWHIVTGLWHIRGSDGKANRGRRRSLEPGPASTAELVPIEGGKAEGYDVKSSIDVRRAVRRERELVLAYTNYLRERGNVVSRNKIPVPEGTGKMYSDIFNETRGHLIEAKADASRNNMRMAVGQLADYARFVPEAHRYAVLVWVKPHPDLLALLTRQSLSAIWREGDCFTDNADGAFT